MTVLSSPLIFALHDGCLSRPQAGANGTRGTRARGMPGDRPCGLDKADLEHLSSDPTCHGAT